MFKGKISIIKNINGKKQHIEREFNSQEEYDKFLKEHADDLNLALPDPRLTLSEWGALGEFIDRIFEDRLSEMLELPAGEAFGEDKEKLPVNIDKYEKEAQKLELEKKKQAEKKEEIKRAIAKLKGFVKTFEKEGKKDLADSAKKDIKKLEDELKSLK